MEHLLSRPDVFHVVDRYLQKCKDIGIHIRPDCFPCTNSMFSFDVVELSGSFLSFPPDDWLRLIDRVYRYRLKAKPELGIQFGVGGDTEALGLEAAGTSGPAKFVDLRKRFLESGVEMI